MKTGIEGGGCKTRFNFYLDKISCARLSLSAKFLWGNVLLRGELQNMTILRAPSMWHQEECL